MKERILEALLSGNTSEFESLLHDEQMLNHCFADYSDNTLLHLAAINKLFPEVQILIGRGSEVNTVNALGRTPLYYAISNLDPVMVKFFLESGADIYVKDIFGNMPLFYAITADLFGHKLPCTQESITIIQTILMHSLMMNNSTVNVDRDTVLIVTQGILHALSQKNIAHDMYRYIEECSKSGLLNL